MIILPILQIGELRHNDVINLLEVKQLVSRGAGMMVAGSEISAMNNCAFEGVGSMGEIG
jgi:hypothetical protein